MNTKTVSLLMTAVLAVFVALSFASAAVQITAVEVNGIDVSAGQVISGTYRDSVPVRVQFSSTSVDEDARVKVWFSGSKTNSVVTERMDILSNATYSRTFAVALPEDFNADSTEEDMTLNVLVESRNGGQLATRTVSFLIQRESYTMDILDVITESKAVAGSSFALDIVLKNRGRHLAEDTFVRVTIPALGVESRAYFGDMSSTDRANPDKEDASERRMYVRIPAEAVAGVYNVEVEAYNADSSAKAVKRILIVGGSDDSRLVSPVNTKTFNAGETVEYSMTIVNSGNKIRVYEIVPQTVNGLKVDVSDSIVAIPAGSSKTVTITVKGVSAGRYAFKVDVRADGDLVTSEGFNANVERAYFGSSNQAGLIVVTVLAVVFVVLLIVLIVLLTKKPAKKEELNESYY